MKATSAPAAGFSADTEILTRRSGWVTFDQLTYLDEVATRSPAGRFEWQVPERISCERHNGDMVWLHSRTTDLMVTPDTPILYWHRRRVMRKGERYELPPEERVVSAASLAGHRWPLVATSRWESASPADEVTFTARRLFTYGGRLGNPPAPLTITADDFAAFMGMYLAEGNLESPEKHSYGIWIWQRYAGRGFHEYQALLNRIFGHHVRYNAKAGGWHIGRKALYGYLETCGKYAWGKQIPPRILDLPITNLETFWRYYALGDGTIMQGYGNRKPIDVAYTTSRDMIDRLQEVLQKLGGWGIIQVTDPARYPGRMGKRLYYRILRRAGTVAFADVIERAPYSGIIGCVRVDAPAVYVRRNNRPVWAGIS